MLKFFIVILSVGCIIKISNAIKDPKIFGGRPAKPGQFPYAVSFQLGKTRRNICGGGIINSRWILSAAHCKTGFEPSDFVAYVGSIDLDRAGHYYDVEKIIVHEGYAANSRDWSNDISLFKVSTDIKFNRFVQPIKLPFNIKVMPGHLATAIGWGRTSHQEGLPNRLHYVTSKIVSIQKCSAKWENAVIDGKISLCVFGVKGIGACFGDSGNPLIFQHKGKSFAIGILSHGIPCAVGTPDVFTRVSYYIPWIIQTMREH